MDLEEHARLLGRLVRNLQTLECLLRAYLYAQASPPHTPLAPGQSLVTLTLGDVVPENALTDYSTLGKLITRFNASLPSNLSHLAVDPDVVDIRDALAHGRVSAPDPTAGLTLLKFEKPSGGSTRVAFCQKLSEAWLRGQTTRVWGEIEKIGQAPGSPVVV